MNPIATRATGSGVPLYYDSTNSEIFRGDVKSFIINHPIYQDKYLVHGCLEGPEGGVYYRGKGCINKGEKWTKITLPDYVPKFSYNFNVFVTPVISKNDLENDLNPNYTTTMVDELGEFYVKGTEGKFNWLVFGQREELQAEPYKIDVQVKGDGPYKWI